MRIRPAPVSHALTAVLAVWALTACAPGAPSAPALTAGSIRVEVATSGTGAPEAYEVIVDGGEPRAIAPNASLTVSGIAPGAHTVELAAVPFNCVVDGANPRETIVAEAATSEVSFAVSCEAVPRGNLAVTTTTSGEDVDPDGYGVEIDGAPSGAIGTDDTQVFSDVPTGDRLIELTGLAGNCAVQGDNPRLRTIADGQTTLTTFAIACVITTGAIEVTVSTSGPLQDPDGYTVDLDGVETRNADPDDTVTFTGVAEGAHTVTLSGIASNCDVDDENPVVVNVTAGETADVEFDVDCRVL